MNLKRLNDVLIATLVVLLILAIGVLIGDYQGYKRGQLDYARDKITWSIMDGIRVHFIGLEPIK